MRQVQQALANIGIPVYAGIWRATSPNQNPPEQYCVYSTTTTEGRSAEDNATYEKMEADVVALGKEIDRLEQRLSRQQS